jgi:hypothetical protein
MSGQSGLMAEDNAGAVQSSGEHNNLINKFLMCYSRMKNAPVKVRNGI